MTTSAPPDPAAGAPTAAAAAEGLSPEWAAVVAAMTDSGVPVAPRSGTMPLRRVNALLADAIMVGNDGWSMFHHDVALRDAARAGIAPADLMAFAVARPRDGRPYPAGEVMRLVHRDLGKLGAEWPDMTVRDALGWAMVYPTPDFGGFTAARTPVVLVEPWVRAGLMTGWLYAAAGLTPDEAREALDAGPVDEDRLRMLAGLRGVPLPV